MRGDVLNMKELKKEYMKCKRQESIVSTLLLLGIGVLMVIIGSVEFETITLMSGTISSFVVCVILLFLSNYLQFLSEKMECIREDAKILKSKTNRIIKRDCA